MLEPIEVLLDADRRAAEILRDEVQWSVPTVLRGPSTHTAPYLLRALEEQGWTLAPKDGAVAPDIYAAQTDRVRHLEAEIERLRAALENVGAEALVAVAYTERADRDDALRYIDQQAAAALEGAPKETVQGSRVERLRKTITTARALLAQANAEADDGDPDSPANLALAVLGEALEGDEHA